MTITIEDFLTGNGSPLMRKSDNAKVIAIKITKKILRKERMQQIFADTKHQNQNRSEKNGMCSEKLNLKIDGK